MVSYGSRYTYSIYIYIYCIYTYSVYIYTVKHGQYKQRQTSGYLGAVGEVKQVGHDFLRTDRADI